MNNYKVFIDSHFKTLVAILEKDKLNKYAIMFLDKHNKMVNLFTTKLETESDDENIKYFMDKHLDIMKDLLFGCYFDEDEEANVPSPEGTMLGRLGAIPINEPQNINASNQVKKREYRQKPKINIVAQQPAQQPAQQSTSPRSETFEGKYYGQLSNKNLLR